MAKSLSVVVPVHNESALLRPQVTSLLEAVKKLAHPVEVILVENGSTDGSDEACRALSADFGEVRVITQPVGDYGLALRAGILSATHEFIVVVNVDFWNAEFIATALSNREQIDLVVGSKRAAGARDARPWLRRAITRGYNSILTKTWGFSGTDTHGMKLLRRSTVAPLVQACVTTGFIFDTELVLRAERAGLRRMELPTDVHEMRGHGVPSLARRVPDVVRQLWRLGSELPPLQTQGFSPVTPSTR